MSLPIYIVVTPFFPSPNNWRGSYCYDFVKALKNTGKYDVYVFVPGRGGDYCYQGIAVYQFPVYNLPSAIFPFLFSAFNQRSFLRKIFSAGIDVNNVAVCHAHTAFFAIYPLAVKELNDDCTTLLHHHDLASFGLNLGKLRHFYLHKLINFLLLRRMHEKIDCHVFISEAAKKSFVSVPDASWSCYAEYRKQMKGLGWWGKTKIKRSIILHNGVDCKIFTPASDKLPGFTIGCIGNFTELKSQITLLEAVNVLRKELPEIKLRFVGSGETLFDCRQYVLKHHLECCVTFENECDHHLLPHFYREIDLFVLPSYFEGFGCVFAEAAACGVPFITCEGQGVADLILPEERALWLFAPKDSSALANRIRYFFEARPNQTIASEIEINQLVSGFIEKLSC